MVLSTDISDIIYLVKKLFFELLYYCGLRRSEARGLQWKHIDFKNKLLTLSQQVLNPSNSNASTVWYISSTKTEASNRTIPVPTTLLNDLSELGYKNYWKVLNAKDYGIPQNRERVFIISIRNDIAISNFSFPQTIPLLLKLKDLLEDNVDEKYYLSEKGIGRLIKKNNKIIRNIDNPNISACIIAGYHKMDGRNNQYISENNKVKRITGIYDGEKRHQAGSIYNPDGLSPTLTTMADGGNKQPYILVREGTRKGYMKAREGDCINISYPNNITKRGRVGKNISQTILTSPNMAVLENQKKIPKTSIQDRVYDENGIYPTVLASGFRPQIAERRMFNPFNNKEIIDIAPTQTAACGNTTSSAAVLISEDGSSYMRIRKLTPLECWRLMGFEDEDFYKAKSAGISDTQLYRQARK